MTGYHIKWNSEQHRTTGWTALLDTFEAIVRDPEAIAAEYAREFTKESIRTDGLLPSLKPFLDAYRTRVDGTVTYYTPDHPTIAAQIMLSASGGGPNREIREAVHRAVCRLVMFYMHQRGIEVDIVVA